MIRPLLLLSSFILCSQVVSAAVINVADHGIVPGKDVSHQVNKLVESLQGESDVTLFFPKGQYTFYPEHAVKKYRAVTNHDNSVKPMAFPFFGHKDITLDGDGSTFMFYGKICPITLEGSEGITLKNFTIDWDTPFHHELRVVESDAEANSFVAELSPMKYGFEVKDGKLLLNHYNWQDPPGQNIAFDSNTKAPIYMTKNYSLNQKQVKAKQVGENRLLLERQTKKAPPVGTVISMYGPSPGGNRFAQAIHVSSSKDTVIDNVTVYAAGGMALIAERSENIFVNELTVTSREDRTLSTRADATHFLGCKGVIRMENCLLEHMADDGINVHGAYVKINEYKGDRTFLCAISHVQQLGLVFAEPGDKVMITSRETLLPIYETTVEKVEVHDEELVSVTVADVPDELPEGLLSLENLTWYPDVIMKHNVIRDNRARSALISTKGSVLIEDNFFSSQMHGILIEGDNNKWYESGGVQDITINRNTFVNIGYGSGTNYPLFAAPLLRPEQYIGAEKYHRNIRFTNNTLKSFNGLLVHAFYTQGLVVAGNTIELDAMYPTGSELPSIDLDYCEDVTIKDNTYTGFDWPIRIEQTDNCTNVRVKKNRGLSE